MDDDDFMTEEDRNREYLRQHPAHELSLWQDWVLTVCTHRKMAPPTGREWDALTAKWHHNKMPITSVDELAAMRETPNPADWAAGVHKKLDELRQYDEALILPDSKTPN